MSATTMIDVTTVALSRHRGKRGRIEQAGLIGTEAVIGEMDFGTSIATDIKGLVRRGMGAAHRT